MSGSNPDEQGEHDSITNEDLLALHSEINKTWRGPHQAIVPAEIYHYTTAEGLRGILESNQLWATDLRFVNDSAELEYGRTLIRERIKTRLDSESEADRAALLSRIHELASSITFYGQHYAVCFCESSDLLSQWRGYARGAVGYSIGFKARPLDTEPAQNGLKLRKVIYVREKQESLVDDVLDIAIRHFDKFRATKKLESVINVVTKKIREALDDWCLWFKHPAFSEESEWRLIVTDEFRTVARNKSLGFMVRNGVPTPYIPLSPSSLYMPMKRDRLWILSVRHGPAGNHEIVKEGVRALLDCAGHTQVSVRSTEIPFRIG